ncbi:MAG TPA: glycosyltransferase [Haliscomenobacter sp.]|uniref:glycosyltransferase n=1 Tax=Haliscomenobacter sp. TaxID=2717303 RepID=UPI002BDD7A37|nr:glycosyltransferase [Haliscomenobacter sp.]HOY18060.1 glycosyltransferase [Haliscomenobacter sp.]
MSLPKVLIINQPFNTDTGGGITLSNLFTGWDKDKLAVACSAYILQDNIDTNICNNYYQLGQDEHKWMVPFNYLKRKYPSGPIEFDEKPIQNLTIPVSKLRVKVIMNLFYPILEYFGLFHAASTFQLSPTFCSWMDEFKPDVIYAQASDRSSIAFCIAIQAYLKKKMVFHMMDDWPSIISSRGLFKKYWQRKIDAEFRALLDRCTVLMSISDYMSEEYLRRYGKTFIPFHNPIDVAFWKQHPRTDYALHEHPTVLYAGRTGLGIQASLKTIANAIQQINEELKLSIQFVLQTAEMPEWASAYSCVQHRKFVPYQDLPKVFSAADLLILPYDFSPRAIQYIKYSMPTKASEYMASGTPIVIFAPKDTAVVRYAEAHAWAEVVTENQVEALTKTIKHLISSESAKKTLAQNAQEVAVMRHDLKMVSGAFKEVICSAVEEIVSC